MIIGLHIDERGLPFIRLAAFKINVKKEISNELLELFIREAKKNGVVIQNESEFDFNNSFASIRIKDKK